MRVPEEAIGDRSPKHSGVSNAQADRFAIFVGSFSFGRRLEGNWSLSPDEEERGVTRVVVHYVEEVRGGTCNSPAREVDFGFLVWEINFCTSTGGFLREPMFCESDEGGAVLDHSPLPQGGG